MTDPIADMLTRIRNAVQAKHARVDVPASTLKCEIARILQDEGYIAGFKTVEEPPAAGQAPVKQLRLFLKYGPRGEQVISGIQRILRHAPDLLQPHAGDDVVLRQDGAVHQPGGLGIGQQTELQLSAGGKGGVLVVHPDHQP